MILYFILIFYLFFMIDNIFGNMTKTGINSWYIGGTSAQTKQTSSITVTKNRLALQPWAYNTLECYGCGGGCSYEVTLAIFQ